MLSSKPGRVSQDESPTDRTTPAALVALTLLALVLRLYRVDAQGLWYDELFAVTHSMASVPEMLRVMAHDFHPPLHNLLLRASFALFGVGAVPARLVSVLSGTLSVPLMYAVTRRFADRTTALSAALLLAVSQIAIYFSQEARPYAVALVLSLWTIVAFLRLLERPSPAAALNMALATFLFLTTHYYDLATLAALALYWLMFHRAGSRRFLTYLAMAAVLVTVAYTPWLLAMSQARAEAETIPVFRTRDPSTGPNLMSPVAALNRFNNGKLESIETESSVTTIALGATLFTLPILVAGWRIWRRQSPPADDRAARLAWQGIVLGALLASLPVAVAMLFGYLGAVFNYRHFSFSVAGYLLAVAIGWRVTFGNGFARAAWIAAAMVFSLVALRANYFVPTRPDYRTALTTMAGAVRAGDCAAIRPTIWNDEMHYAWRIYFPDKPGLLMVPFRSIADSAPRCERLWILWDRTWWMNQSANLKRETETIIGALPASFDRVAAYEHPALDVILWQRRVP
jgi:4-amino-4-deoxy-L-arabinose transferase-like glycosyltransferase